MIQRHKKSGLFLCLFYWFYEWVEIR